MDKKSTGPYKHYERPTEKRSAKDHRPNGSGRWIATIVILAVILIALVPIVYRLASNHSSEKATEVQTVKKTSLSSKSKSSQAKKKSSASSKSNDSAKTSSSSSEKTIYTVKTGDTLTSIAQKHGLTVDQLAKLNNLKDTSNVNIGQTLKLK
ncbi:SAG1386/EF1546 family surface-associated protein [Lactobacillus amylovorus]|uniref:SAG1386/EF1546 family surface-associated protein n=1 Tax=Lactobacillus amylovorus TaxID=1604 RepID=UPI00232ACD8B|nr:SAG1386/EF1546 family surface-associated protein [Lactobacillus amylovorus]MDB6224475.1 LysM peptidoglycan-binding domain-containing protein [Lactobacillus amylovorus]